MAEFDNHSLLGEGVGGELGPLMLKGGGLNQIKASVSCDMQKHCRPISKEKIEHNEKPEVEAL